MNVGVVANFVQGNVLYKGSEAGRIAPVTSQRYIEIKRGTVIFTPNSVGRYSNLKTGNHVAVFLSYGRRDEIGGIYVIDQYIDAKKTKQTSSMRFIKTGTGAMISRSNDARAFAVVYSLRQVKINFTNIKFPKVKITLI
jgi:hypothetical protein